MEEPKRIILRGQIWTALLKTAYEGSSIQIGERPIIIVSNNVNNEHCNNLDYLAITSQDKKKLPTHVLLDENCGLFKSSIAMAEQGNKIPKSELRKYIGMVDNFT
jgi:mRNA interferase MazF